MKGEIAVLGGSFNPPHYGHLTVAKEVLKSLKCDEVWLLPCFKQAEGKKIEKAKHRLAMVKLAVKGLKQKRIKASDLEIRFLKNKNYTADTVRFLKKRFPKTQFYWVFGSELVKDFPKWSKWKELRKLLPLVIYPRPGVRKPSKKFLKKLGAKLVWLPSTVKQSDVSSTEVRAFLKSKDVRVKKLIPPTAFDYVSKHGLYGWKVKK